jgi:hypothetical protein
MTQLPTITSIRCNPQMSFILCDISSPSSAHLSCSSYSFAHSIRPFASSPPPPVAFQLPLRIHSRQTASMPQSPKQQPSPLFMYKSGGLPHPHQSYSSILLVSPSTSPSRLEVQPTDIADSLNEGLVKAPKFSCHLYNS